MKKIFITGGAGFIAHTLTKHLINNNKIIVYDNFKRDSITNSFFNTHPNLKIIKGDVLDFNFLTESMKGSDIVIHAAAIAGIDSVVISPVETMKVNMIGTANTLEAAHLNKIKERFIDFSTSEVFGSMAFKSVETDDTIAGSAGEARWTYAVSKLAGEHLAHAYHTQYNLPVVTVRPFNVYGPNQTGESAIQTFIKKALNNETITIHGDGDQIRAWCYIEDFIEGILKCIYTPNIEGESFNIGNSRTAITILGLAEMVCRILNSKSKIIFSDPLSADIALRIPSTQKAADLLDFKATINLENGILKTAKWVKKNIHNENFSNRV
tara:strand:+ start:173 stop:1144 length:972 start_codon:yes stop_codon:yes gene_type:complete